MYKIFEKLLQSQGVSAYFVSKETGVAYSTLSAWKQGNYHPKDDKLSVIADFFDVPLDYLKGKQKEVQCPVCHMDYNPVDEKSFAKHKKYHDKFLDVQKHYGISIPSRAEVEQERADALAVLRDIKYDKFRRMSAFTIYAKYEFLSELYNSDFELNIDLDEYTKQLAEQLRPDVAVSVNLCNAIRAEYGLDEYSDDISTKITEREFFLIKQYRELTKDVASVVDKILDADKYTGK